VCIKNFVIKKGFIMGISSLGVGSNILTQDVLDQLRSADEASVIKPITLNIANENDKKSALDEIDATMKNLSDSIGELKNATLFNGRSVTTDGTSAVVTAEDNSDLQDFSLDVTQLATKQIEESGSFGATTDTIASGTGSIDLKIGGDDFTIDYDSTTTLDDLKKQINTIAGKKADATIAQVASGDYRLFISSVDTGAAQSISITDNDGNLSGTQLTDDLSSVQDAQDANFKFNGEAVTRASNDVSDLVTGYDITLKETGLSNVSVKQNRDDIMGKIDSFVKQYNAAIDELDKMTKSSIDTSQRGIFSSESTIKSMKSTVENMIDSVGGSVGNLYDFGFNVDKSGVMTVDKSVISDKLDANSSNVEAFFTGGDYENSDGSTTTLTGAFTDMSSQLGSYTDYNGTLDQFQTSVNDEITQLQDNKTSATERLDSKYAILKKKYVAYNLIISQLNSASTTFTQLASANSSTS